MISDLHFLTFQSNNKSVALTIGVVRVCTHNTITTPIVSAPGS